MAKRYKAIATKYAEDVVSGKKIAGKEIIQACQRFLDDLKRDDLEYDTHDPDFVINIIEMHILHKQGEIRDTAQAFFDENSTFPLNIEGLHGRLRTVLEGRDGKRKVPVLLRCAFSYMDERVRQSDQ